MALDERYFISLPLDQYFVDKDSRLPLSNGTITFYRDNARSTLKTVYELNGTPGNYSYVPLPNPITLSGSGTVVNDTDDPTIIYFYPFDDEGNLDLYYVVGRNSDGIEQWSRQAWPNLTNANNPLNEPFSLTNQMANPQFTNVFINDGDTTTLSVTAATNQVFHMGPDWDFIVSGTGSVTIERIEIAGNDNVVTSPPYVLDVTVSAGVTSCFLNQRMYVNSGLWASTDGQDIYLSGLFIARNEVAGTVGVQMFYNPSSGGDPILIVDGAFTNSLYTVERGTTADPIPLSTDTNLGNNGYVDIYLSFTTGTHVRVSSVQVVPTLSSTGGNLVQYNAQTSNREEAYQGDWYIPNLSEKRIPSLLVGWDFPVNPGQFGTSGTLSGSAAYIWDQTIGVRGGNAIAYARSAVTGGLEFTTSGSNNAFYIMQYLDGQTVKELLNSDLSVNVNAYKGSVGSTVTMRLYLCKGSSASSFPSLPTTIGTLSSDGSFTVNASNWSLIDRGGLGIPKFDLDTVATSDQIHNFTDFGYSNWQISSAADINATDKFAIVATFSYVTASTVITVNSISLNLGNIPSRPAARSVQDTLLDCQYYWQQSYPLGTVAGTAAAADSVLAPMSYFFSGGTTINMYARSFGVPYKGLMRSASSIITIYTPGLGGAANSAFAVINSNGVYPASSGNFTFDTYFTEADKSTSAVQYHQKVSAAFLTVIATEVSVDTYIQFHYTNNARIGEV